MDTIGIGLGKIFEVVVNTLIVSIPEETFLIAFTLILIKRFDLLEFKKACNAVKLRPENLVRFFIPVVLPAVLSNILRYSGADEGIGFLVPVSSMILLLMFTYKMKNIKDIIKAVMCFMLSIVVLQVIEFSYTPLALYSTSKTIAEINNNVILNFVWSLPERIIEYSLIAYLIARRFNFLHVSVIKTIMRNKMLSAITALSLVLNVLLMCVMCKLIGYDKILANQPFAMQLIIITANLMFPVLSVAVVWSIIYYIKSKQSLEITLSKNKLRVLTDALEYFYRKGQSEKVEIAINDIKSNIDKLDEIV